ncbi:MAG: bifunctional DNA-formamidopyrimidine glycosylase/DNA-(apurinic or apyrimidinic site) lyase [Anaerolineae bacterium]|nr:bifunctional DNA-formamidopyrimidine glycosylase/DNA-(apurinic or apyrimidinic site) lyase [Anaerolineae bacterium]
MPELPEVETTVNGLRTDLLGRSIVGVRVLWEKAIDRPPPPDFASRLSGQRITSLGRRGKFLLFHLEGGDTLIIHLRMTGHLGVMTPAEPLPAHVRLVFTLDDGRELRFRDMRKFGRAYLVADAREVLGNLGPEPLGDDFTAEVLRARLGKRGAPIKSILLDQRVVAGIGNIYADEALFYAGIHPKRPGRSLAAAEAERLRAAIRRVLTEAIADGGTSLDSYRRPDGSRGQHAERIAIFRKAGSPCPHCGTPIVRIVLGGRSTHFCPHCQT